MILAVVLLALGLVLIVEGLVYALAPSLVEELLEAMKADAAGSKAPSGAAGAGERSDSGLDRQGAGGVTGGGRVAGPPSEVGGKAVTRRAKPRLGGYHNRLRIRCRGFVLRPIAPTLHFDQTTGSPDQGTGPNPEIKGDTGSERSGNCTRLERKSSSPCPAGRAGPAFWSR